MRYAAILACLLTATPAFAGQQIDLKSLDKLAARATEKTEVTLDSSMLKASSGFLNDEKNDEASVKKALAALRGVYVRAFEFDSVGAYSEADLKPLRDQLRGKEWKVIVSSHGKDENVDVLLRQEGDKTTGLVVIAAEAKELTVINIEGSVDLQTLAALGGQLGIPKVENKAQ
jgi:hypothetical protein